MHCLITYDGAEGLAFLYLVINLYTSSEGSGKSTYTYAQAHLSLYCSTLQQVPKSIGFSL